MDPGANVAAEVSGSEEGLMKVCCGAGPISKYVWYHLQWRCTRNGGQNNHLGLLVNIMHDL